MRCIQCGASLIGVSTSSPAEFSQKFEDQDAIVYGRTWSIVFALGYYVLAVTFLSDLIDNRPLLLAGGGLASALGYQVGKRIAKYHNTL
ncbi:hypothetical protein [Parachitinimonas caeni]|uniref:SoxR reducing system RseC family protein n=1 Tax=Parachitinimonas caeni TaxID=3031301 RepID=A0ABT7E6M1_9NEIS|nr:hypothetical protein [Parachitinimonas caeni]MDK2126998.1 hypothetical protein [Parachitinimonas caeni]